MAVRVPDTHYSMPRQHLAFLHSLALKITGRDGFLTTKISRYSRFAVKEMAEDNMFLKEGGGSAMGV